MGRYASAADIENPAAWQSVANSAIEMTQVETATHTVILVGSSTLGFVAFAKKKPANACDICIEPKRKAICATLEALHSEGGGSLVLKGQIQKKLCASTLSNQSLAAIAGELTKQDNPSATNSALIRTFMDELSITCNGTILCGNNLSSDVVKTWKYLYTNHSTKAPNARKTWNTLVHFGKLNENVKEYIIKFSDESVANSSLIKFCADLTKPLETGSSVLFLDYVNDANNFTVVKKMVSHKLTTEEFEEVGEEYQIETSLVGLAKTWVDRSDKLVELKQNGEDGRFYGKRAVVALLNNSLNLGIAGIDQSQYKVFNEVQLWVDKAKDQYMIADILLVKFDGTNIEDVIICESKLSASTDYTKRQKQGWRLIHEGKSLEVKVDANSATIQQTYPPLLGKTAPQINRGTFLNITNSKYKRISDAGNKDGGFSISTIPISNYSTYQAKN